MGLIEEISEFLQKGRSKKVKELVQKALDENMDPKVILNEGLLSGMMIVGAKFKNNEVFVPEVLVSARAMNAGLAGFEVCDMGVDVGADAFIDKAEEIGADVIGMSALLSTTMPQMQECIRRLEERGLREKYIVMIGGAPVTDDFAKEIGADYYTPDAASAAETARNAVMARKSA